MLRHSQELLRKWWQKRQRCDRPTSMRKQGGTTNRLWTRLLLVSLGFWIAISLGGGFLQAVHGLALSQLTASLHANGFGNRLSPSTSLSGQVLFEQGQQAFDADNFESALELWQQAGRSADAEANPVFHVAVLNSVAIANQRLGEWSAAQTNISVAFQRLTAVTDDKTIDILYAQLLNTRGRGEWFLGQLDAALATWEQATDLYQAAGDQEGAIGSQLNQVQVLETLGYYRQACDRVLDALAINQTCENLGQVEGRLSPHASTPSVSVELLLRQIDNRVGSQPDNLASSQLKVLGLRSLGNLLRLTGQLNLAQQVLYRSLEVASVLPAQQQVLTQLSLAATQRDQYLRAQQLYERTKQGGDRVRAAQIAAETLAAYDQVIAKSANLSALDHRQAQLQRLSLLITLETWNQQAEAVREFQTIDPPDSATIDSWPATGPQVTAIAKQLQTPAQPSRVLVNANLNLAQQLLRLQTLQPGRDWLALAERSASVGVSQADQLGDRRSQSYAYGILAQVYERQGNRYYDVTTDTQQASQRWTNAQALTRDALRLSQLAQIPEITYRWQWQLGRLADQQNDAAGAIIYYEAAVQTLDAVRNNLLGIDAEVQFSFRDDVEPIYRRLVELLLTQGESPPSQAILQRAIQDIDALQLSELENFLGCNLTESVALSETLVDPTAAVIYPIILPQKLAVIAKFPETDDLHLHTVDIEAVTLNSRLNSFRRELARPYQSEGGLRISQELYDLLIRPIQPLLVNAEIETLVFVLDGKFRNVPMATLHDGETYLIQQYALALMPGLQLIEPQPLSATTLDVLTFGLSQMRQEFPPHEGFTDLVNVEVEVNEIKNQLPSRLFLNQDFTQATLADRIEAIAAPIVHLATHGQFSSEPTDTFVLAWDRRIDINTLSAILQSRNAETNPIELLVLSACKTAEGDDRAALGLAGIAVRSGARSTLASLWTVDDQATADMMSQFYRELAQADSPIAKAEALRRAQVKLLESGTYKAPRYWSPFILVGNWL